MGDEKPEAPKVSPRVETFTPSDHDHDAGETHPSPIHTAAYGDAPVGGNNGNGGTANGDGGQLVAQAGDPPPRAQEPTEKKTVTDKADAGDAKADDPVDPYEHIDKAQGLAKELESLAAQNRKPDEVISIRINGELKEMKVSERVTQLKQMMAQEIETAKKGADSIRMKGDATNPGIDDIAKQNTQDRDRLAKDLGLDPSKLNVDVLGREFQKANGNKERQDKIKELATVLADRDALSRLHFAPMAVRLVEAEFAGRGYLDPKVKLGEEVPDKEIQKAFELLKAIPTPGGLGDVAAFGNGKEINEAKEVFATSDKTINILYMHQQQTRGEKIIAEVNAAKLQGEKDPEAHYKNAIRIADTLNVGYLANQTYKDENMTAGISQELVDTVRMGSTARLKYAEFLAEKGRFHEAQGLLAQVKADSPELIYQKDGDSDNVIYRKHDDGRTYEDLDRAVTLGVTVNPATFELAHGLLFDKLGKDKIGTIDDGKAFHAKVKDGTYPDEQAVLKYLRSDDAKSTECLKFMKMNRDKYREDITAANKVLDQEVQRIEAQKKAQFDDKQNLTKDQEVEKARLERQLASLNNTKAEREAYMNRIDAITDFTEGIVHLSQGGAKSAHELFSSALKKDPSLDAELTKMKAGNPDMMSLTDLNNMTDDTLDAYRKRNYKKFAVAGAAIAGTLTGVGLIGVCGYVGAGVTTTAVVATTGGALAGGGVGWGIHRSVNPKAGWPEFRDSAKIGGLSAALVASPWAAQAYRAKLGTDVAATSQIGNLASKIGVTRGTLAGSLAMSYTFEAGNVLIEGKPVGKAVTDGTKEGVFNSLMLGISRNWGLPTEGGAIKTAVFNRYTVGTGFGLAAFPQIVSVAADGKPVDAAVKDTMRDGAQYTLMLGLMNKLHATDPSAATGLGRLGLNRYTVGGGFLLSAAPELKNYYNGKPGDQAVQDWFTNGLINTASFAFLKKYGLSDYGTGSRIAAPTMRDAISYGSRAFLMQESWNAAVSVGMKQISHDLMGQPYYIKEHGQGFVAPLVADFFDRHYGAELDPKHPGDRKVINQQLDQLNTPLTSSLFADKKNVDPRTTGPKKGIFFDYSKKPDK